VALLDLILRTHNDFSRLGIAEEEHFLCGEGDDKNGDIVLQNFAVRNLLSIREWQPRELEDVYVRPLAECQGLCCRLSGLV
jgi:hypothetical protein